MAISYLGHYGPVDGTGTSVGFLYWGGNPVTGDLNITHTLVKPYSMDASAPAGSGWSSLGTVRSGTVANAVDAGSLALSVLTKVYNISDNYYQPVWTGGSTNPAAVTNHTYHSTVGNGWIVSAAFGADTDLTTTNINVTCTTAPRFTPGNEGMVILGQTSDTATLSSPVLTIPGCTISALISDVNYSTTTGNDLAVQVFRFNVVSGTSNGSPPSFTATTTLAANSSVPLAVIRIAEPTQFDMIAAPSAVTVIAPPFNPPPRRVATGSVTVAASPVAKLVSNVRSATVAVSSPAATLGVTLVYGEMAAGNLPVSTTTSGFLRAINPAVAASEGMTAPVEVQIWKPDNSAMLAVADGRMNMQWLDDLNDSGSGSFELSRWDPKATFDNLALFNIIHFIYSGRTRFASRIESRQLTVSGSNDHAGQVWQIQGRGALAMLGDAMLYPEYGINEFTQKKRSFFYGSKKGSWYVPSEWVQPRGLPLASVPADHPWHGFPTGWPDPDSQWIWPTDPNTISNPGPAWFRSTFALTSPATVTVYASADDQVTLFVDGLPAVASVSGDNYPFRKAPSYSIRMAAGEHLIACEVLNTDASLEEVKPIVTSNEVRPTYAADSNLPYIGKGYTDAGHPYVNSNGSVDGEGTGAAAFDGNVNSSWISVGNYLGWSSAYEWVEGTFSSQTVTAVRVQLHGGPYTVYISLKNGDNGWNGDTTVPYRARTVNADTAIRYVREVRTAGNQSITVNVPPQVADRIRITVSAEWDSGLWQYRWRGGISDVVVTSETREGSYIRGGNFAGLLVTVATTDDKGAVTGIVHRSRPEGWLCKTGDRPGWRPSHILTQILAEAQLRNVLGTIPIKLGFTEDTDSYGVPWTMARKDVAYDVGLDYLSLVKKLAEDSEMDVWIDPETLTLQATTARGDDHTTGISTIILRPGQSLTDFTVESGRPSATRMIVESEFGWMEVAEFEPEMTYGRVEGFVSLGNALSTEEARTTATNEMKRFALESYDTTIKHTDVLGPRPYVDYAVGDKVLIPIGIGSDSILGINRVLSLRISEGDAGELDITVEADREFFSETDDLAPVIPGFGPGMVTLLHMVDPQETSLTLIWTNPVGAGGLGQPIVRRVAGSTPPLKSTAGAPVPVTIAGAQSATDTGLIPGTTYSYAVWATDVAGTLSSNAATITVSTLPTAGKENVYGVPVGTTLTTLSSANNPYSANTLSSTVYKITTSGTFTGWRFNHRVEVYSGNVTFINCRFTGAAGDTTSQNKALLNNITTGSGTVLAKNCTFDPAVVYDGIDGVRGCRFSLDWCELTRTVDGVQAWDGGAVTISNTWFHDFSYFDNNSHPGAGETGTHNDGIQISSGSNYTITDNLFDGTFDSAGVYVSQALAATSNVHIERNTFTITSNGADINVNDSAGSGAITGLWIKNNIFGNDPTKYQMLITKRTLAHASTVITDNVWIDGSTRPPIPRSP